MGIKTKEAPIKILDKGAIRKTALWILSNERKCNVWINNNLAVRGRAFIGRLGVADIIGFSSQGLFVGCEVKTIGDRLSDDQKEWLKELKLSGGIALIAEQDQIGKVILKEYVIHNQ